MAVIIYPDGKLKRISPSNGTDFKIGELQKIVGGYIEIVTLPKDLIMVVNEEGKLQGLDLNIKATILYGKNDAIVGNVLVCESKEVL